MGAYVSLRYLYLAHNSLIHLFPEMGQLRELWSLEHSADCLRHLPTELSQLSFPNAASRNLLCKRSDQFTTKGVADPLFDFLSFSDSWML